MRKLVDHSALVGSQMLQDLPLGILALVFIFILILILILVTFIVLCAETHVLLVASEALTVETVITVVAVLVIAIFVVNGGTVVWASVKARPFLAADIAE
jgi:hypothetical protein